MLTFLPLNNRQRGVSLIIVLIMVLIIGLTSVAAIRSATSSEKVTLAIRSEKLTQQYADAALKYCESEIALADADPNRDASLKEAMIDASTAAAAALGAGQEAWEQPASWVSANAGAGLASSLTTIGIAFFKSAESSYSPSATYLPQCLVEKVNYPVIPATVPATTKTGYMVTARAFSPDYKAKNDGTTDYGSVVWVQSLVFLE